MSARFHDEAIQELNEAVAFYNGREPGLGAVFAAQVPSGLVRITAHPNAWHKLGRRVRRYRLNRFPYGLVYAVLPGEILVVAVMHMKRRPGYWRERL